MAQLQKDVEVAQVQYGTRATMNNRASKLMKLDRHINWFGHPSTGSFPPTIAHVGNSKFLHVRDGQLGSMAAVQYSCPDETGRLCAWILAWHSPADNTSPHTPNKVYVISGTKYRMDNTSWEQVLMNLERSSTHSQYKEPYSKTTVDATISDSIPNYATLTSNFGFYEN